MKNFRVSALLFLCVIALFGWLWWREREPALPPGVQVVARFLPDEITRIVLKNDGQPTLQLQKEGDDWKIAPQVLAGEKRPVAVFADAKTVHNFLGALTLLRSDVVLQDDKKEYGLQTPRSTVELNSQSIEFGAPPFFDDKRVYARVENRIALLPRALAEAAARPLEAWRDRKIARFEIDNVNQLILRNGQKIVLQKRRATEIAPTIGGENWLVKGPIIDAADSERVVQLLQMLHAFQVQKFLDGEKNWGFEKPTAQISLDEDAPILTLGRKTPDGYAAYGRVKDAPFVVSADVAQMLLQPLDFWRSHRLLSFDLNAVRRVKLHARGQNLAFERNGARWQRAGSNAPDENAGLVADILVALRDWRAQKFLLPTTAVPKTVEFRLILPGSDGEQKLEVWRDGTQWRARVFGPAETPRPIVVLSEAAIEKLNVLVERLLAPPPTPAPARIGPSL